MSKWESGMPFLPSLCAVGGLREHTLLGHRGWPAQCSSPVQGIDSTDAA